LNNISFLDIYVIIIYFTIIMIVGFYYSHKREQDKSDYFLAGRNVGWFAIGTSIFAANISSEHFIGLAGYGATRGLVVGNFEWMAIIFILLLGWFFTPIFLKSGIFTMPEYFGKRYDSKCRLYISGLSIIAYVLTKVTVTLIAGGLLLEKVFGFDIYISNYNGHVNRIICNRGGIKSSNLYIHGTSLFSNRRCDSANNNWS
jgi:SSS family solute:Na+ symporter